jgi:hypothetical protein
MVGLDYFQAVEMLPQKDCGLRGAPPSQQSHCQGWERGGLHLVWSLMCNCTRFS